MSTFYTTFLSKSDFSFALLLVTFEPLEVEQRYIPFLKALMCGINAVWAQGCGCMFTFCHAPLKIAVLLHKTANASHSFSGTVYTYVASIFCIIWIKSEKFGSLCRFEVPHHINTRLTFSFSKKFARWHKHPPDRHEHGFSFGPRPKLCGSNCLLKILNLGRL